MRTFNSDNLDVLRAEIKEALKAVTEKHGVKFTLGNITYRSTNFTTTLSAYIADDGLSPEKAEWDAYCGKFDMKKDWFGEVFLYKGERFKIIGIKKYGTRLPAIGKSIKDGKTYNFSAQVVQVGLLKS